MKFSYTLIILAGVLFGGFSVSHGASEPVGFIKSVEPEAYVVRNGETLAGVPAMKIHMKDLIRTGEKGGIGLIFKDDTVISMGPESEISITEYLFEPVEGKLSFLAKMVKGTVSFVSGQISKLSPGSIRIQTPEATIGMRGTHVLVKVD